MKYTKLFAGCAASVLALILVLGGCNAAQPNIAPTPSVTRIAQPTATAVPTASATPAPTPTPIATTTPEPTKAPVAVLTVREGDMLVRDIIPKLTAAFFLSADEVKVALAACPQSKLINEKLTGFARMEGILIAGEYEVFEGDTLEEHIITWVKQSETRYDATTADIANQNDLLPYQRLILASIVESECLANMHYDEVAAVFLNRLDTGMKLQSCVTSEYAVGYNRPFLLTVDVKTSSPYNTYDVKGLPIGPISVVDELSLLAASRSSSNNELIFFIYRYVQNDILFFADYADFKVAARASRVLFESTMDMDPHEIIDKRDFFG